MIRRTAMPLMVSGLVLVGAALSLAPPEKPSPQKALAEARLKVARRAYDDVLESRKNPPGPIDNPDFAPFVGRLSLWSRRWMEAQRDLSDDRAGRIVAIEAHVERLKAWEKLLKEAVKAIQGRSSSPDTDDLEYQRLEAESLLVKVKGE